MLKKILKFFNLVSSDEIKYINDFPQKIYLDLKDLSKKTNKTIEDYAISGDIKQIACFTKRGKVVFLSMTKFISTLKRTNQKKYKKLISQISEINN